MTSDIIEEQWKQFDFLINNARDRDIAKRIVGSIPAANSYTIALEILTQLQTEPGFSLTQPDLAEDGTD